MGKSAFRKSVFIYDFLLKLYPKSYRHEFGEEMRYVFSELLKETYKEKGEQGIITLWSRTILDVGKTAITQHIENQKGGDLMNSKNSKKSATQKYFKKTRNLGAGRSWYPHDTLGRKISLDNWGFRLCRSSPFRLCHNI